MISLDRGLFGSGSSGDVLERHKIYAEEVGSLDIIVFASDEYEEKNVNEHLRLYPTKSNKNQHFAKSLTLAKTLAKKNQYDLLVTQDFAAPAGEKIKKALKIPWIITIHGMFFSSEWLGFSPLNWYLFYRIKKAVFEADGFRVNNHIIEKRLQAWGIEKPILVSPTPVDVEKFLQVEKDLDPEVVRILYVGRLSSEKNLEMLIRVFKMISGSLELWIVGEGGEEKRLKEQMQDDQRIKFLGPKSYEELLEVHSRSDIFVLPSNTETYGKVLLEAAASRSAIVSTKTTGAMSILSDDNSLLVEVGDDRALGEAITKLATDAELREMLGKNAKEMAKTHDRDQAIEDLVNFWKEIAEK